MSKIVPECAAATKDDEFDAEIDISNDIDKECSAEEDDAAPAPLKILTKQSTVKSVADVANVLSETIKEMEGPQRPPLMISINNPLRASWDILIIFCLVYIFFIVPLEVTFDEPSSTGWIILGNVVDLVFWTDIVICFRTTFVDDSGHEIWDPKRVAKGYIKDFFFIDLICCLPGYPVSMIIEEYVMTGGGEEATLLKLGKAPRVLKVVRTLKLVKVFRVLKIARYLQDIKDTVRGLGTFVKMMKLLVITTFFLHINACMFSLVGLSHDRDSWILDSHLTDSGWREQYLNALYWSATTSTTVGYGDIAPINQSEKIFCIMSMCVGVCLYGYIIGSMTEMVTSTSYVDNKVQQQLDEVHAFITRHRLPRNLVRHVLMFFRHHFKRKKMIDERRIMEMMPHELLRRCQETILKDTDLMLFKLMDSKHFPIVMELLIPRSYTEDEIVISATHEVDEPILEFFVLLEGEVSIYSFGPDEAETPKSHEQRVEEHIPMIEEMYKSHGIEDDSMTHEQLESMLTALLGRTPSKEQVAMTMKEIDDDGSGTIEVEEFVEWFVSKKIEGPMGYGVLKKVLSPVTLFGTYTGFGLGQSNITYVAKNDCDVYTVSSERLCHEFSAFKDVMKLINFSLVDPAKTFGAEIDITGPDRSARKKRMEEYAEKLKQENLVKIRPALRRLSRRLHRKDTKEKLKAAALSAPSTKSNDTKTGDKILETAQNALLLSNVEKKIQASEQRILDAITAKLEILSSK